MAATAPIPKVIEPLMITSSNSASVASRSSMIAVSIVALVASSVSTVIVFALRMSLSFISKSAFMAVGEVPSRDRVFSIAASSSALLLLTAKTALPDNPVNEPKSVKIIFAN